MLLTDAVIELRYAKDWSKESARWYAGRLKLFTDWAATQGVTTLEDVTPILVRRYLAYLQERPSATGKRLDSHTVHGHVRIIRTLLFWAVGEGLIDENVPKRIKPPKKEEKVLHVLSDDQLTLLFKAAAKTDTPLRDTALLYLLLDTGCRASELCGLKVADVTFAPDVAWILVHGKGRKQREVALGKKARLALSRYVHRERQSHSPYLFIGARGPLTPVGLDRLLYRLRDLHRLRRDAAKLDDLIQVVADKADKAPMQRRVPLCSHERPGRLVHELAECRRLTRSQEEG